MLAVKTAMKHDDPSKKQLAFTLISRGLLAAGGLILMAQKLSAARRKRGGWPLVALGAASTIPLAIGVAQNIKEAKQALS